MTTRKTNQQGFTLIELMIVIAIVGILAAVALPAYQDYTIRAKMSEPMALLGEAKTSVAEYFIANGSMPGTAEQAGLRTDIGTDIVASMKYSSNVISVQVQDDVGGSITSSANHVSFSLTSTSAGTPEWACRPGDASGDSSNNIPTKYLPANCRG
jgi:type IV pilus assembly protein PilA